MTPSTADVSVRPAAPEDAPAVADIHARTLRATLQAGIGAPLAAEVAAMLRPERLLDAWAAAIREHPTALHLVLVALAGPQVTGFAALAPADRPVEVEPVGGAAGGRQAPGPVAEILALEVPAAHGREGHGSRLLAACADLAREQGVARLQTWAVQGEEARARFLASAGFAPLGVRRTLDVGGASVVEVCWHAAL